MSRPYLIRCTTPLGKEHTIFTTGDSKEDVKRYFWSTRSKDEGWKLRKVEREFPFVTEAKK